jgi:heme exporter protein B
VIGTELKTLLKKELVLEWRSKFALGGILLYVLSTIFVAYLSFVKVVDVKTWNALLWVIILFVSTNAVSKAFVQEDQSKLIYLYTLASPQGIILSKIIYHAILVWIVSMLSVGVYITLIGNVVQNMGLFLTAVSLGSIGLSSVLTLVSAIAAQSNNNVTLMSILSFPILLPLLITLIKLSGGAIDGLAWSVTSKYVIVLALLNVIVITLSYILFPYLWRD